MNNTQAVNSVLYRVDGNHAMGLGHLFRARSLCKQLIMRDITPVLITLSPDDLADEIKRWGFTVHRMADRSEIHDCLLSLSEVHRTHVLIQDIRDTEMDMIRTLQSKGMVLIHFDDLGSGGDCADFLIDANRDEIDSCESANQIRFFGKRFMVLDQIFSVLHDRAKKIPSQVEKMVISMGGSDPRNLTEWVVEILTETHMASHVAVVTGKSTLHKERIQEFCENAGFVYIHNTDNMAQLLYDADLAVISGGITLYEAAAVGCPSIVIPQVDHQYHTAKFFERNDVTRCPLTEKEKNAVRIKKEIISLCADKEAREAMSVAGKRLVDGKGVIRIADIIKKICDGTFGKEKRCIHTTINS